MNQGINVEEIKKYNEGLRAHTERAAKIKAELEINTNELNRICEELTAELGVTVTPENIEAIYKENVEKINNTLQTGNDVLRRIAEEEEAINNPITLEQPVVDAVEQQVTPPSLNNMTGTGVNISNHQPQQPQQAQQAFIPNPGAFGALDNDEGELPPLNFPNNTIKI